MSKKKVSFDFDQTLGRESVQKYAKTLKDRDDLEVWIVTRRYDSVGKYTSQFCEVYGIPEDSLWDEHMDLFRVADECGISRDNIHFCNMDDKWKFFEGKDFVWHLDDDWHELVLINKYTNVKGITHIGSGKWRYKLNKMINEE